MSEFNAADRKSIRKREKEAAKWANERKQVVVEIMSSQYGRRWMWEMIELAQVFRVNSDPATVMFSEGQRSIGNALMQEIISACPEEFIQAMREANGRSSRTDPNPSTDTDWDSDTAYADDTGADASERYADGA